MEVQTQRTMRSIYLSKMNPSIILVVVATLVAVSHAQGYKRLRQEDQCAEQGFFQDANDCQKFYRCADLPTENGGTLSQRYEFTCPPGTVFDENISVCNHANAVESVSPQCIEAVGETLAEIYRRPSNGDDGQYNKNYYQNQGSNIPASPVATKPKAFNYNSNNNYNNKNTNQGPFLNVYQPSPFQVQVPQYQQQVVYQQRPLQYGR